MKKFLLAGVAAVALASGAQAADLGVARAPVAAVVMVPVFNWSGVFVGAQIGYGWGRNTRENTLPFINSYNSRGLLGGVHLGYNHQINNFVLGVVADIEAAGISGNDAGLGGSIDGARINWQGSLRARAGIAFDRALIYATGGLAFGGINYTTNGGGLIDSFNRTRAGWTIGGGVEYAFTPNWTAHVEYRYTDFGRASSPNFPGNLPVSGGFGYQTKTTTHTVRLGVSYLFSTGPSAVVARY
ncbi:MAG: porin family protein [Phreatobacter sp.]|uniref:outer membrane protein n=1 Tax=Phreatobacter sp. TaxID=1966341 RepID=UPI001A60D1DE|nr:outer membrane protein [Phreatobacter sp.]MBL8568452.1 porin family protein [Phreatobacter sp.]